MTACGLVEQGESAFVAFAGLSYIEMYSCHAERVCTADIFRLIVDEYARIWCEGQLFATIKIGARVGFKDITVAGVNDDVETRQEWQLGAKFRVLQ